MITKITGYWIAQYSNCGHHISYSQYNTVVECTHAQHCTHYTESGT